MSWQVVGWMQDLAATSKAATWRREGLSRPHGPAAFAGMCITVAFVVLAIAFAGGFFGDYLVGVSAAAVLCGVVEAQGRCGQSHIGMIAPLRCLAPRNWLKCSLAYSVAGLATSYVVGLALAGLGTIAATAFEPAVAFWAAGGVALVVLLHALKLVRFNLPQCDRQTHQRWMAEFGMTTGAGMWGAHIGLAFLTVVKYGGLYPLTLIAIGCGVGVGEFVLVAFWVGRIIPLWLAPALSGRSGDGVAIVNDLRDARRSFGGAAACGLAILGVLCVAFATSLASGSP